MERIIKFDMDKYQMPERAKEKVRSRENLFMVFTDMNTGEVNTENLLNAVRIVRDAHENHGLVRDMVDQFEKNGFLPENEEDKSLISSYIAFGYSSDSEMWNTILDKIDQSK